MSFLEMSFLEILAYVVLGAGGLVGLITLVLYVLQKRKK